MNYSIFSKKLTYNSTTVQKYGERSSLRRMPTNTCRRNDKFRKSYFATTIVIVTIAKDHHWLLKPYGEKNYWGMECTV